MSAAGLNLERINEAIDLHDDSCNWELLRIELAPFEVDRLGWDEIRGIPIVPDETMGTGRFRLVCENDLKPRESIEAVAQEPVTA